MPHKDGVVDKNKMMFFIYILQSVENKKYYIDFTKNLNKKITEHNNGYEGKFTKFNGP
ncbi:MAG: GIY-YIG nuclease family protein [Patescibacteria group bacterium]|nr:GIY-YIG nuclease family protein [Patescibacteria group bacterium]